MASVDIEPCWAALFALMAPLKVPGGFATLGRVHVKPPVLTPDFQPACFLVDARETYTPRPVIGAPGKMTLSGFVIVYFQAPPILLETIGTETLIGSTMLNALLKQVRAVFQPDDLVSGRLTLGGLVHHCWLEGDADKDPGIYSQQGAAILPVRMLLG